MVRNKASKDSMNQLRLPNFVEPYRNQGLFADHFLKDRLPERPEWQQAEGLELAFDAILKLYSERTPKFTANTNEPQTEKNLIQPILNILWREKENDCYEVQVSIPSPEGRRQPDYAFFQTAKEQNDAEARKGTLEYWRDAPALGDAKKWSASLDKQRGIDDNPSAQICNYLYRSHVRWGILTNGRVWRLYEREKSSTGGIFYEVNLEDLLSSHNLEQFKYFYLFFRREAFLPDQTGNTFVEKVFQGSVDYATEVGDRLKESVYDALCMLINGFFEHPDNELDRRDPDTLKLVHENCLIILYRLLFLLYAEARPLLPRNSEPYASYSLYSLQQQINTHLRAGETYLPEGRRFWNDLISLFGLIDSGSSEADIPAYNGGLFSPSNHPHIAHTPQPNTKRWEIGDRYLAQAIDLLAYERECWNTSGERHVDYATLDVQHLGSIYEGLLELQPRIAPEPLVETIKNGKPLFKPESDVPNPRPIHGQPPRTVSEGEVYLATDRGERKATGSYYTPKYIVQYIVENTVGPLTEEAEKQVRALRPEVDKEIAELKRKMREWEKSSAPGATKHITDFDKLIEEQKRRLLEPYLSLKILDPAMGSGHFLVGAADFLSLAMATDPHLLPLDEVDNEAPQAFYKRLVVERCLYGVDLNVLAVELAKLSLWLHTVSKNKALSFLDHHLRCGNSLIGARIEDDLKQVPPELNARGRIKKRDTAQPILGFSEALIGTHLQSFLDTFRKIMETPTGDAKTERMKDKWYRNMDSARDRFRSAANCWLAPYFGVPVSLGQYQRAVRALHSDAERQTLAEEKWFNDAQVVAHQKRFFHWELEFPEVFFNAYGFKPNEERGFDAVIENPPYVNAIERGKTFSEYEKRFCKERFASASGAYDLYILFIELAINLTRPERLASLITPNKFLSAPYAVAFREYFCRSAKLLRLLNLSRVHVFEDPSVYPIVTVIEGNSPTNSYDICVETPVNIRSHNDTILLTQSSENLTSLPENIWGFLIAEHLPLIMKSEQISEQLRHCCTVRASSTASESDAYKAALTDREGKTHKKFINTGLIDRYSVLWNVNMLTHGGTTFITPYLDLSNPAVTEGRRSQYSKPKIVFAKIAKRIEAFLDRNGKFTSANTNFAYDSEYDLFYLLAVLNSNLMSVLYGGYFGALIMNSGYFQFQAPQLRVLPIRRLTFTTPPSERELLLEKGKRLYESYLSQGDAERALEFVEHQLTQIPERADVVHDLLAFLAEQMTEMNKVKQTEIKGFFKWLERYIGTEIDSLKNKTKLRAYHEHDFGMLLDVLRQNRRKLKVDPVARDVQEDIEREFIKSMAKLTPLKAEIAATDRLIDQIVYRLYGLTEEEVAVIEEAL